MSSATPSMQSTIDLWDVDIEFNVGDGAIAARKRVRHRDEQAPGRFVDSAQAHEPCTQSRRRLVRQSNRRCRRCRCRTTGCRGMRLLAEILLRHIEQGASRCSRPLAQTHAPASVGGIPRTRWAPQLSREASTQPSAPVLATRAR